MRGDPRVDPKKRYRPNRRFSVALPFSYFCDSEENRGSSGNFELEENQCVHSGSTFPDGNTECNSTGIAPSGLGRFVRLEGRLPSRADSPSVQETAGFQVSRQDLRVQGLAVRPKRLSVGLFKASCYGNSTPSPAGHPHILLSGRLAHRRRVSIGPSVTSSNHSSVGSESGVHCQSKEVGVYPSEDARLPRSFSRYPQVNCASGRTQSFGSSVAHPGTRRVSDGSCPPVAESSRTFGQPCGSGSKLQASHAASSVALPSILYPSVRLSVEADSDVSRNQGSVCSLGVSGSSPRRDTVLPTPPPHYLVLTSDASQSGWGATLPPHRVSGTWSLEDSLVHINSLELKAVFLALKSLEGLVAGQSLLIRSDNTTVVSYINFQGGTHSPSLCLLAIELWEWCILRGIYLLAAHIPGKDNLVADFLSRGKFLPSEWTLNPLIFRQICQVIVPQPEIDLFASTLNFQLPKYCARCRDPQAWRVDALSFPWLGLPLYAFPPFSILPTVLEKIAREGADVALVAPFWPQRPWFLKLLSLLAGRPRALPLLKDLVYLPMSCLPHPRLESLHLTLWPLSGEGKAGGTFCSSCRIHRRGP